MVNKLPTVAELAKILHDAKIKDCDILGFLAERKPWPVKLPGDFGYEPQPWVEVAYEQAKAVLKFLKSRQISAFNRPDLPYKVLPFRCDYNSLNGLTLHGWHVEVPQALSGDLWKPEDMTPISKTLIKEIIADSNMVVNIREWCIDYEGYGRHLICLDNLFDR